MVHKMTDATNSTFQPNGAGMYLCPKPAITYTMPTMTATTAHIAYSACHKFECAVPRNGEEAIEDRGETEL